MPHPTFTERERNIHLENVRNLWRTVHAAPDTTPAENELVAWLVMLLSAANDVIEGIRGNVDLTGRGEAAAGFANWDNLVTSDQIRDSIGRP